MRKDWIGTDKTPVEAKELFKEAFGSYPILHIEESYEDDDLREIYGSGIDITIDVEKLDKLDEYCFGYIANCLESVYLSKITGVSGTVFSYVTSHKYSFSDTDSWWDCVKADGDSDRDIYTVYGTIE